MSDPGVPITQLRQAAALIRSEHGEQERFHQEVADWLERVAEECETGTKCDHPDGCCNNCEYDPNPVHALSVSYAYIGNITRLAP